MAWANHSLQSFFVQKEFLGELIVVHLNVDTKAFLKFYHYSARSKQ